MPIDTSFYDKESVIYSRKRYEGIADTYIKWLFQSRRKKVVQLIGWLSQTKDTLRLLDYGCGDGIITQAIVEGYSTKFATIVCSDISSEMLRIAEIKSPSKDIIFALPQDLPELEYNVILALGFLNPAVHAAEIAYFQTHLKPDGLLICTLSSKYSLPSILGLREKEYIQKYMTYKQYDRFWQKDFEVVQKIPNGLFVPKLWAFPKLARWLQPKMEVVMSILWTSAFHEQIYVLKLKQKS